jgi:hypothetical protein
LFRLAVLILAACQSHGASEPPAPPAISVSGTTTRVVPGHPCRASVEGVDLEVGGPPLLAQVGADRWTGEDSTNGVTFKRNGVAVARLYANQLFDADGVPLVRVLANGDIADRAGRIVRHAQAAANTVQIGAQTITNTSNPAVAALLAAPEAEATVRGLAVCYLLQATP